MASNNQFAHLHVHTSYSLLDGHAMVDEMFAEAARLGQPAIATTNHGYMHDAYEAYQAGKKHGVKAIVGIEAYFTPGGNPHSIHEPIFFGRSRGDDKEEGSNDVSGKGSYTHMTMLAENNIGMRNLFKMSSLSSSEGFYKKPRFSLPMLAEHSEGIIATTGCPSGDIQTRLRLGQWEEAVSFAAQMQDILGKENYFLELMDHQMAGPLERGIRDDLLRLAKTLNIPLLATNDLHYTKRDHAISHEHMLAMQTGKPLSEPPDHRGGKRFAFEGEEYYVKSREEMERLFPDLPEALDNTVAIAERCNISFDDDADLRPKIDVPIGLSESDYLRQEAFEGMRRRLPLKADDPEYIARMEEELRVIILKNYVGYFLVVSDFVRWAKNNDVTVGHGRGSAGGSLLAYALDITDLDPIRHGLIFERFINPERDSPPDIDMDFDDANRDRVIEYVTKKYGADKVAMIVTFGKIGAKSGLKDAGKILELPYSLRDEISKAMPAPIFGREMTLNEVYNPDHPRYDEAESFRTLVREKSADEMVEIARGVSGRVKSTGVHAAGIILSSKPLVNTVPLMTRQKDGATITQFDYPTCETLGLLKVDFLGLRNLTVINSALKNIKMRHGVDINLVELVEGTLDDEKTFDLVARGDTLGVFQLDGGPMRDLLRRMRPSAFNDISAVLALYRPGPMGVNAHNDYADRKTGRQRVVPIHPELEEPLKEILGDTYQLIVFQEQVMQIAAKVANYSLAKADNLRRAMGKKKRSVLEAEYVGFAEGMKSNGYSDDAIKTLWDILVPFADYSFNRSHTAGYGLISYTTAYLKANYPSDYMAALLSSVTDSPDKTSLYLNECRRMGIKVLPPDVRQSNLEYRPTSDDEILFGLHAVRNVGEESALALVRNRESMVFNTLNDFLNHGPYEIMKKQTLESLALAGGFDSFGYTRRSLMEALPSIAKAVSGERKKSEGGQDSLFSMLDDEDEQDILFDIPHLPEYPKQEKLAHERHAIGLYVSDHPLSNMERALKDHSTAQIAEILVGDIKPVEGFSNDGPKIQIAGVITDIKKKTSKASGEEFAILTFEDLTGSIEIPVFSKKFKEFRNILKTDHIYTIVGTPRARDTGMPTNSEDGSEEETKVIPNFIADSIELLKVTDTGKVPVGINLRSEQVTEESVVLLKKVLSRYPGDSPVYLKVWKDRNHENCTTYSLDDYPINANQSLLAEVREIFGIKSMRYR